MFEHFINENEPATGARRPRVLFIAQRCVTAMPKTPERSRLSRKVRWGVVVTAAYNDVRHFGD